MNSYFDKRYIKEWRDLGFYYDFDNRFNQWRFYGSKQGLENFVELLNIYVNDPKKIDVSEHEHLGPDSYLKIMTWDKPIITKDYFAGTILDLLELRKLIESKLQSANPGETFNIENEFGINNSATTKFFVMSSNFDPASMDESLKK